MLINAGSLSPIRGSFDDHIGDAVDADAIRTALSDVASSSNENNRRSSSWISSEDETDAVENDDEGFPLSICFFSLINSIFSDFYALQLLGISYIYNVLLRLK